MSVVFTTRITCGGETPSVSSVFHDCLSLICLTCLTCHSLTVSTVTCGLVISMEMFWTSRWRLAFGLFSSSSAFGLMHILAEAKIGLKTRNKSTVSIIAQPADNQSVPLCIWWTLGVSARVKLNSTTATKQLEHPGTANVYRTLKEAVTFMLASKPVLSNFIRTS